MALCRLHRPPAQATRGIWMGFSCLHRWRTVQVARGFTSPQEPVPERFLRDVAKASTHVFFAHPSTQPLRDFFQTQRQTSRAPGATASVSPLTLSLPSFLSFFVRVVVRRVARTRNKTGLWTLMGACAHHAGWPSTNHVFFFCVARKPTTAMPQPNPTRPQSLPGWTLGAQPVTLCTTLHCVMMRVATCRGRGRRLSCFAKRREGSKAGCRETLCRACHNCPPPPPHTHTRPQTHKPTHTNTHTPTHTWGTHKHTQTHTHLGRMVHSRPTDHPHSTTPRGMQCS